MATKDARPSGVNPSLVELSVGQTGNGVSTNIADRGSSHKINGTVVRIISGCGATPTCTYQLEVSVDGTNWVNATWADSATPTSDSTATFASTTDSSVKKIIKHTQNWRYVRVTMSANTNVTNWIDVLYNDGVKYV
jgi:hypothetical protein